MSERAPKDKSGSITIEAASRTGTGKSYTRKLRLAGKIPANLSVKGKSTLLELDPKLLPKAWKENNKSFDLTFNGTTKKVLITELQIHAVKRTALHVDLTYAE